MKIIVLIAIAFFAYCANLVPELTIPRGGRHSDDSKMSSETSDNNTFNTNSSKSQSIDNTRSDNRMVMDSPQTKPQAQNNDMMTSTPF